MIHIKVFREHPEVIIKSLEKRHDTEKIEWVKNIIEWDKQIRILKQKAEDLRARRNKISLEINENKKKGADVTFLLEEAKDLPKKISEFEIRIDELAHKIHHHQMRIPNILHDSVPYGESEEDNVIVKKWGEPRTDKDKIINHYDWIVKNNYADIERAAKTSGARFYFLKGKLVDVQRALIQYAIDTVKSHNFVLIYPPYLVHKNIVAGATDLEDFKEVVYKVEDEDLYLIPTAEHALLGFHYNEMINEDTLPKLYAGFSSCFRKEAGAHGKDTKGIFRVHQFNKVEMFVYSKPEDSWQWHEKLLAVEEEIVQGLGIPYRVVNICTGDIGIVAAKKYDVEAWMPASQKYREIMSCSNCTSYQSVRSNIRLKRKDGTKEYVHTLNATALADTRMLVALIENFMQDDGTVKVPEVLKRYLNFDKL
ncbi:serine--tRNA ligase [Candidatus Micrarchaeota archaeon]|nr:serine--tRNA ligase [Candidatus Micrarchaeota archaeon]